MFLKKKQTSFLYIRCSFIVFLFINCHYIKCQSRTRIRKFWVNQFFENFQNFSCSLINRPEGDKFSKLIYNAPYARIGPYIVGLILGYIIYAEKVDILRCRLTRVILFFSKKYVTFKII